MFLLSNMLLQKLLPSLLLEEWVFSLDSSKASVKTLCVEGRETCVCVSVHVFSLSFITSYFTHTLFPRR